MFQRFFMGRNGPDHISLTAMIAACIIMLIPYGVYAALALAAYAFIRMFSKNVEKRRAENYKFVMFMRKIKTSVNNFFAGFKKSKTHKIFSCPKCGQKLRVPRGKGRINITCSNCAYKFIKKT